jgi:hypothetical protein
VKVVPLLQGFGLKYKYNTNIHYYNIRNTHCKFHNKYNRHQMYSTLCSVGQLLGVCNILYCILFTPSISRKKYRHATQANKVSTAWTTYRGLGHDQYVSPCCACPGALWGGVAVERATEWLARSKTDLHINNLYWQAERTSEGLSLSEVSNDSFCKSENLLPYTR